MGAAETPSVVGARRPETDRIDRAKKLALLESRLFRHPPRHIAVGRYLVHERLGAGGFGAVYRGHDPLLRRPVAVKVLQTKEGAKTTSLLLEARSLAALHHPNVVEVFDVGTIEGSDDDDDVFIVMELLEGPSLFELATVGSAGRETLLSALLGAAAGLAAAHAVGIVHRDFKPGNVILASDGRARVVDFGLASVRQTPDRDKSVAAGTPRYMSPEAFRGEASPASDQYAFAVAFTELWCGADPFGRFGSRELVTAKHAPLARTWFRRHGCSRALARVLCRALHPLPARRYRDMDALADALRRATGRTGAKRPVLWLAAVAALLIALVIGFDRAPPPACAPTDAESRALLSGDRLRALRETWASTADPKASVERLEAKIATFAEEWSAARASVCDAGSRGELDESSLAAATSCLQAQLMEMNTLLHAAEHGDAAARFRVVRAVSAHDLPRHCLHDQERYGLPPAGSSERAAVEVAREQLARARGSLAAGLYADGREAATAALRSAVAARHEPTEAEARFWVGVTSVASGDADAGRLDIEAAYFSAEATRSEDLAAASAVRLVSVHGYHLSDPVAASAWTRRARVAIERLGDPARHEAALEYNLGLLAHVAGDEVQAEERFTRALAAYDADEDDDNAATCLMSLGVAVTEAGDPARALEIFEQARYLLTTIVGEDHPDLAVVAANRALAQRRLGHVDAARASLREARAIESATLGDSHPRVGATLENLAALEHEAGNYPRALELHEEALAVLRQTLPDEHPTIATVLDNMGVALVRSGRADDAVEKHREALDLRRRAFGDGHALVAAAHVNLTGALLELGRYDEAETTLALASEILGRSAPAAAVEATALLYLGELAARSSEHDRAREAFERGLVVAGGAGPASETRARLGRALGRSLALAGLHDEARARLNEAAEQFRSLGNEAEATATIEVAESLRGG